MKSGYRADASKQVVHWSISSRVKIFVFGLFSVAVGVGTCAIIEPNWESLFIPQILLAAVVLPVLGLVMILQAINPSYRVLVLDEFGCLDRRGRRKTYIAWRDVESITPVDRVFRWRLVNPGISGFGLVGAAIVDIATHDPSVASAETGRANGVEFKFHPNRVGDRKTYFVPDKFEIHRAALASRMEGLRRSAPTQALGQVLTTVRTLESLNARTQRLSLIVIALLPLILVIWMLALHSWSKAHPSLVSRPESRFLRQTTATTVVPPGRVPSLPQPFSGLSTMGDANR